MPSAAPPFRLQRAAAAWLRAAGAAAPVAGAGPDWEGWLWRRMLEDEIVQVGRVLVDRAVLRQRFACVPERCAPRAGRGRWRSCCADAALELTAAEQRRLRPWRERLSTWLARREPRLREPGRWLDPHSSCLLRPGGRCVFSRLDGRARIRCHLHAFARAVGAERRALQPLGCRLFPLALVETLDDRVLLTVVSRSTSRLLASQPPARYPCLSDPALPPLLRSQRRELDELFGAGFTRALRRAAAAAPRAGVPGPR